MIVKLEDEVRTQKVCDVRVRPALHAAKCDGCGKIFKMKPFCNDDRLAQLSGTFAGCAVDPKTHRGMGNGFTAFVCSFKCAHEVFANGGWRKMPEYKPFADADINLVRCELKITSYVIGEQEIREEWGKIVETPGQAVWTSVNEP